MSLRDLYPSIEPYNQFKYKVSELHTLWIEESGNPNGFPVIFLHGGPGAGCEKFQRQFFDPSHYRIILIDQRGCGRSTPHAELKENTTQDLISDIEKIRSYLNVENWLVFGGSWGSTLALAYAQAHSSKVAGLILRGIFLCRPRDIRWFYQDGASKIFPDLWQSFLNVIPEKEQHDMVSAYHKRLVSDNSKEQFKAALAWSIWEGSTSNLNIKGSVLSHFSNKKTALSLSRIESHYFVNDSFMTENQILSQADRLAGIPGVIVHGRYDVVCPIEQAFELHHAWPDAEFIIAPNSGHSATEIEIVDALVSATDKFRNVC